MTTRHSTIMQIRTLGALMFSFDVKSDHLLVSYHGAPETVALAQQWCEEMDAYGARRRRRRLVIDGTRGSGLEDDVNSAFWAWMKDSEQFDVIALLIENRMVRARVDLKARRLALNVRAFETEDEASEWIAEVS